jgi:hypothetical protein
LTGGPITVSGALAVNFPLNVGGENGSATTVARSDHHHDSLYLRTFGTTPFSINASSPSPLIELVQGSGGDGLRIVAVGSSTGNALDVTGSFQNTVLFRNVSTTGTFTTLRSEAASPMGGVGILGLATATTGVTTGVQGAAASGDGIGVDGVVQGATGTGAAVRGVALGSGATAGRFWAIDPLGKILSGQAGPSPSPTEVFSVDSGGNISTQGGVTANTGSVRVLGAGQGIILKSPDGGTCAQISLSNAGALVTTVVPCP